jgi:hypothetical protein
MTIDTKTARIVYRCKKCKVTVARDAEYAIRRWTETKICFGGGRMEYEKSARRYVGEHYDNAPPSAKCPACARTLYGDSVKGTTNDTPCNEKCVSATGFLCECSCGGHNHAGRHVA